MKHNQARNMVRRITALLLLLAVAGTVTACGQKAPTEETASSDKVTVNQTEATEEATAATEESDMVSLETKYGILPFPRVFSSNLKHLEVVQDPVAMEVFYLANQDREMELYRIYFGDETTGTLLGYLTVAAEEIPVTYTVCIYNEEDFPDAETRSIYGNLMDGFSTLLNAITADSRFCSERSAPKIQYADGEMRYWTVNLPTDVEWVETEENGIYRADFYGTIRDERIPLYTITLGDAAAPTLMGNLLVNGEAQPVGVQSHFTQLNANWTPEEISNFYRQMETIDLVIQAITESEYFSD